jgi:drug/metabolite transporter (DMT)-like permease
MPTPLTMTATDWLLLVLLSVLWGGSFFFAQIAVAQVPPLTLALARVAIAALLLVAVLRAMRLVLPFARLWGPFLILGFANNVVPFTLLFWGQIHIPSGLASILNATTPLFTVVVAHAATDDDKLTPERAVGLAMGFAGVVAMIGPDLLAEVGHNVVAQLACLTAALSYACGGVYGRRLRGEPAMTIAAGQLIAATAMLAPVALLFDRPWSIDMPSTRVLVAIVGLAAVSTAFAYIIYFRVLARAGATNVMLVTFMIPVSAILLGTLVLGETLAPRHFAGMAAIAFGLAAIDGRPARLLARAWNHTPS